MLRYLILLTVSLTFMALVGCERPILLSSETREYQVIDINPPKHFYVKVLDVQNHDIHEIYVSKHCGNWKKVMKGSRWSLTRLTYRTSSGKRFYTFKNKSDFCAQ